MAVQTIQTTARAGINLTDLAVAADAALSDKWLNTGAEMIAVINGAGGSITATETLGPAALVDGLTPTARVVTIPAGKTMLLGPFPPGIYNDGSGYCSLTWSAITSIKVCVFKTGT